MLSAYYLVAHVNAWQDDHADDPLLSVMDAIDRAVAPLVAKKKKALDRWNAAKNTGGAIVVAAAKGAAFQVARKAFGAGADEIAEIIGGKAGAADKTTDEVAKAIGDLIGDQGKAMLASFRASKRTIAQFRESLDDFLHTAAEEGQKLPLFVLVDELDRCRPPFAIAMLERMKHLFDIDNVVFVVATDTEQLSHSINAVYGAGFDGAGYLSRFFNRSYHFEKTSREAFVGGLLADHPIDESKLSLPPNTDLLTYLTSAYDYFALPLRNIEQVHDILRTFVTTWGLQCKAELVPLLPIVIAQQQRAVLPMNGDFGHGMDRLAARFDGAKTKWRVIFAVENFRSGEQSAGGIELSNSFAAQAAQPLKAVFDSNHSSTHGRWILQRLAEEFQLLHGNQSFNDSGPYSIIMKYAEMVRSAGRLSTNRSAT